MLQPPESSLDIKYFKFRVELEEYMQSTDVPKVEMHALWHVVKRCPSGQLAAIVSPLYLE